MGNVISTNNITAKHYLHSGFSSTILHSYSTYASWSIAWRVLGVITGNPYGYPGDDTHVQLEGFSSTVIDSYVAPGEWASGMTWDGSNVISADISDNKHYKHLGFSSTITDSYTTIDGSPAGLCWVSPNLLAAERYTNKHYKHSGFSSAIIDSYASPHSDPEGIDWDGSNVISADAGAKEHYKHSGFSSTIIDSYAMWIYPRGLAWIVVPTPPSNVTAHYQATDQAYATWTDNADNEEHYDVQYRLDGGSWQDDPGSPYPASTEQSTAFSVGADHRVEFRVRAMSAAGFLYWVSSKGWPAYTTPDAPSGCAASYVSDTRIDISWNDDSAHEQGFRIERKVDGGGWVFLVNKDAGVESHSDGSTSADHKYEYRVRAYRTTPDELNSSWDTSAVIYTTPDAPSGCGVSYVSDMQIDVSWTDNSAYEQGFRIERKVDDGSWAFLVNKDAEAESHSDGTTSADHKYEYRVRAYRTTPDELNSGWDTSAVIYTTPAAPSACESTYVSDTRIDIGWADNSAYEQGFRIERRVDGGDWAFLVNIPSDEHDVFTLGVANVDTGCDVAVNRGGCGIAVIGGKVYFAGGARSENDTIRDEFDEYDYSANLVVPKAVLPAVRNKPFCGAVGGKVYVIGGSVYWTPHTYETNNWEYDPATNTWDSLTKALLPTGASYGSTIVYGNKIYCVAGATVGHVRLDKLQIYTPATDSWTQGATLPSGYANADGMSGVLTVGGKDYIYHLCGISDGIADRRLIRYDIEEDAWETGFAQFPIACGAGAGGVLKNQLVIVGGYNWTTHHMNDDIWMYDPVEDEWTQQSGYFEINEGTPNTGIISESVNVVMGAGINSEEESYNIGKIYSSRGESPEPDSFYSDKTTSADHKYEYRVRAYRTTPDALDSAWCTASPTYTSPAEPSFCVAQRLDEDSIKITWADGARYTEAFELQRQVDAESWVQLDVVDVAITTYTDNDAPDNHAYKYRVRAIIYGSTTVYSSWAYSGAVHAVVVPVVRIEIHDGSTRIAYLDEYERLTAERRLDDVGSCIIEDAFDSDIWSLLTLGRSIHIYWDVYRVWKGDIEQRAVDLREDSTERQQQLALDNNRLLLRRIALPTEQWTFEEHGNFDSEGSSPLQDGDANLTSATYKYAQSFQVDSDFGVGVVALYLKKTSSPSGNLTVKICADNSGVPGDVLHTYETVPMDEIASAYGLISFFVNATPWLEPATTYWVVLEASAGDGSNYISWGYDGSSPTYTDGVYAYYNGSSWSTDSAKDFVFRVEWTEYDTRTGKAGDVIKAYLRRNAISGHASTDRVVSGLTCASDLADGETVTYNARSEKLLVLIQELALAGGLNFQVTDDGEFQTKAPYLGEDKTKGNVDGNTPVVFSLATDTLLRARWQESLIKTENYLFVGGDGTGSHREVKEVQNSDSVTDYGRREAWVDAAWCDTDDKLTVKADMELRVRGDKEKALEVLPAETRGVRFMRDWQLGDLVTVKIGRYGVEYDGQIVGWRLELVPKSAPEITPIIGDLIKTQVDRFRALENLVARHGAQ